MSKERAGDLTDTEELKLAADFIVGASGSASEMEDNAAWAETIRGIADRIMTVENVARLEAEVARLRRDRRDFLTLLAATLEYYGVAAVKLSPRLLTKAEDTALSVTTDNEGSKTVRVNALHPTRP